jgi:hypothetical protein
MSNTLIDFPIALHSKPSIKLGFFDLMPSSFTEKARDQNNKTTIKKTTPTAKPRTNTS